jgi:ABC-2 type transport system permease protein
MIKKSWSQVLAVAGFTFRDAVRKRAFWITNGIFFLIILVACLVLRQVGGGMAPELPEGLGGAALASADGTCYLVNESAALADAGKRLEALGMKVIPAFARQKQVALAQVDADGTVGLVEISAAEPPAIKITSKDFTASFPGDAVWETLCNQYRIYQFEKLGYDAAQSAEIVGGTLPLAQEYAGASNLSNYVAGIALTLVMFLTIYVYGDGVAMSVATEKSTRVMETLIVSTKPSRILLGKCIAMGVVGLLQMGGVLLFSTVCANVLVPSGQFGNGLRLPSLTPARAALLILYFLLGYALFSMINSMCGAMVSKLEDLQSAKMPAALISVASFYGGYITMGVGPAMSGGATAGKITMLIPFTAPYAATSVLLSGSYTPGLLAASVGLLLVAIVIVAYISGKVYAISVLHYGAKLKFSRLWRS